MLVLSARRLDAGLMINAVGTGGPDRFDRGFNLDHSSLLKRERELNEIALLERLLQIHQHYMITTRRQHNRSAW